MGPVHLLSLDAQCHLHTASATLGHVQELHFCMDASGVPLAYGLTIIQICMLYPRKLMFICKADLTVKTWVAEYQLPTIDTYFMVNCYDQDAVSAAREAPLDPVCGEMPLALQGTSRDPDPTWQLIDTAAVQ